MKKLKGSGWLDTNVILRYLLRDHEEMFKRVNLLFDKACLGEMELYINILIIAELVWTLESFYEYEKKEIFTVLMQLIDSRGIQVMEKETVKKALVVYMEKNVDFIDAYLSEYAASSGLPTIFTLNRKHFARLRGDVAFL
jgi:predicted nucleic-acid-binding protein